MIKFGIQSSVFKGPIQNLPLPLLSSFLSRDGTVEGGKGGENHRSVSCSRHCYGEGWA